MYFVDSTHKIVTIHLYLPGFVLPLFTMYIFVCLFLQQGRSDDLVVKPHGLSTHDSSFRPSDRPNNIRKFNFKRHLVFFVYAKESPTVRELPRFTDRVHTIEAAFELNFLSYLKKKNSSKNRSKRIFNKLSSKYTLRRCGFTL